MSSWTGQNSTGRSGPDHAPKVSRPCHLTGVTHFPKGRESVRVPPACQPRPHRWVVLGRGGACSHYLRWQPGPAAGPGAARGLHSHSPSFLTWVPFCSSLSTAHFILASLHPRSICNVNWETRGSFSFGLVHGRIPRGIQNVLTQINGTNKSKISLAT